MQEPSEMRELVAPPSKQVRRKGAAWGYLHKINYVGTHHHKADACSPYADTPPHAHTHFCRRLSASVTDTATTVLVFGNN